MNRVVFDYFKPSQTWPDLGIQIWPEPDPNLGELFLGSQNNIPDEINGVINAVSSYNEAVQFSASFVTKYVNSNGLCIFIIRVRLIKL